MSPFGRFRAIPFRQIARSQGGTLIVGLSGSCQRLFPRDVANILDACRSFRTINDHVERIRALLNLDISHTASLKSLFQDFLDGGLLVSEKSLVDAVFTGKTATPPRISRLAVITANRPEMLDRCIDTFVAGAARWGRSLSLTIFDDSRQNGHSLRVSTARFPAARHGSQLRYAGLREKGAFVQCLVQAGLSPDILSFALFDVEQLGLSIGANRNAFLLDTIGDVSFSVDDDIVCRLFRSPTSSPGLRLFSGYNPSRIRCFPDRQSALQFAESFDQDLLAAHEQLLGSSPRQAIRFGLAQDMPDFSHELFDVIERGSGRVITTFSGLIGDSGFATNSGYLTAGGAVRERMVESIESYRAAISSRDVLMVVDNATVADSAHCMAYSFAVDCRGVLPPFFPVQRNEDGVLGAVIHRLYPPGASGHVPIAILHDPPGTRAAVPERIWQDASRFGIAELTISIIRSFDPGPPSNIEGRMRALGRYLREVGQMPQREFDLFARARVLEVAGRRIARVEAALDRWLGEPQFWARDCELSIEVLQRSMREPGCIVPCDLACGRSGAEAMDVTRRLIRRYGELLVDWPDILAVARRLRDSGVRLSQPVGSDSSTHPEEVAQ